MANELPYKTDTSDGFVKISVRAKTEFILPLGSRIGIDIEGKPCIFVPAASGSGEVELMPLLTLEYWDEFGGTTAITEVTCLDYGKTLRRTANRVLKKTTPPEPTR